MAENLKRLDTALVSSKLISSRSKAKEMIAAGKVRVNGQVRTKAAFLVRPEDALSLDGSLYPYVSRAGSKLEKAMEVFSIDLSGKICMDVGASTGGFTDCMLAHGASRVYAIDSGREQLAEKLKQDSRVISMEQTNMRYLTGADLDDEIAFAGVDVSFISLSYIFPALKDCLGDKGRAVCLVKPQFEAGRSLLGKKGVIRDKKVHEKVLKKVIDDALSEGFGLLGLTWSPLRGQSGNIEFLLYLSAGDDTSLLQSPSIRDIVNEAHQQTKETGEKDETFSSNR